jgi:hypothetical protein
MKRALILHGVLLAAFFFSAGCSGSWAPDAQGGLDVRCAVVRSGRNALGWPMMQLRCFPEKDMPQPGQTGA